MTSTWTNPDLTAVRCADDPSAAPDVLVLRRDAAAPLGGAKRRVAAYCRVSTDMERQAGSLETQIDAFERMIAERGEWEAAGVYVDDGVTGTNVKHRAQFLRMIDDCEAGRIDYILTKSISRFARNARDCLNTIKRLKEWGVLVYFDDIHLDTGSPAAEMMITILAAVAQEESRGLSENMKLGMRMRFKEGKPKWVATYGFVKGEDGQYRIDEAQAKGVRRIFELYASGCSLPGIAARLAAEGVPAPNGRTWWPKSLSTVLHNEKYVGDVMMQKTYTVDHLTHKKVRNDQTVVPSYYVRDHHEPIVDRAIFERAQAILRLKDRHGGCVQYPYSGRLFCPVCGERMIALRLPGKGRSLAWTCGRREEEGFPACPPCAVRVKYVDRAVLEAYRGLDREALAALAARREDDAAAISLAAEAALRWKRQQPFLKTVEYCFLDELIEQISFRGWNECVIAWTFGVTSRVAVQYDQVSDIPDAEIEHAGGGVYLAGRLVWAGETVAERVGRIQSSCQQARERGDRLESP